MLTGGPRPKSATTRLCLPTQQCLSSVHFYYLGFGSMLFSLNLVSYKSHYYWINFVTVKIPVLFPWYFRWFELTPLLGWPNMAAYGFHTPSLLLVFKTSQRACLEMLGFWKCDNIAPFGAISMTSQRIQLFFMPMFNSNKVESHEQTSKVW